MSVFIWSGVGAGLGLIYWWFSQSSVGGGVAPNLPVIPPKEPGCPPSGTKVALIGDSHTVGLDPHMKALAAACGTAYTSQTRGGTGSTQWRDKPWLDATLAEKPDVVLISMGGNDFWRSDVGNVHDAVRNVVKRVRASGAKIFWIHPLDLPWEDKPDSLGAWEREVGPFNAFIGVDSDYPKSGDKVHLTPAGYSQFAKDIWMWMSGKV